jgi:uncharacterized protein YndB with AHSA1/START domain
MSQPEPITIEVVVAASPHEAWRAFTSPDDITQWNFASPDWCCPSAEVDLSIGGRYVARMQARDGSFGFDFAATYEEVDAPNALTLRLDDDRRARTTFEAQGAGTRVRTVFDPEPTNPADMQRDGWQAILNTFKAHVEASK